MAAKGDAFPWGRPVAPLCKCCGQPGANTSFDLFCDIAHAGSLQIALSATAGSTRSSLTMSSASLVSVEKSGRDFHRLPLPNRQKSTIRSIPKSGSGVITLI